MLKIVDRYIGRQVLLSSFFAVLILSIVLILGNVFKEILSKLVERPDLDAAFLLKFLLYLLPFSLSITIPWGFLTAILLIFGRLSADNELVSLRMAGMSMGRICLPVGILAVIFSGICCWMNLAVAPASRAKIEKMLPDMVFNLVTKNPLALFTHQRVMGDIPGHLIYSEKNEEGQLVNFQMVKLDDAQRPELFVFAPKVDVSNDLTDPENPKMIMEFTDPYFEIKSGTEVDDFSDIQPYAAERASLPVSLDSLKNSNKRRKPETMQFPELIQALKDGVPDERERNSIRTEISMRMSFSMACITLGLIGVPLGITAQRRETSIGFAISLIVVIVYFLLMTVAEMMRENGDLHPYILVWLPNLFFIWLGVTMFRRLSRK